MLIIHKHNRN